MTRRGVWALGVLLSAATARAAVTEGQLRTQDGTEAVEVPLKHTEVAVRVSGFISEVRVEQTFVNPFDRKIEAVYLFPLPTHAAVNDLEIVSGGRTIRGEIKKREDAQRVYREAADSGRVAALLTEERPNLFTQNVANLEPGAEVVVRLRYVEPLVYQDDGYELVYPMVAAPRHVPKTSKIRPEAAALLAPSALPAGQRPATDIGLTVSFDAGTELSDVRSPSHDLAIHGREVRLGAGDSRPDKDFILRWQVAGVRPRVSVVAGDGAFFLTADPPRAAATKAADVAPREMVFVLDASASMAGAPLAKAKQLVRALLSSLGPDDTFRIVRFDDAALALAEKPIAVKPKNLELALAWLDVQRAGGGTDMSTGVLAALDAPADPGRLRIVVFLTDGYVGNEDEVLALVQQHLGEARLFSFGVGSAVNRYLLEELAAAGRGTAQIVRADEDGEAAVRRFQDRVARPLLTDVSVTFTGVEVAGLTPARVPDLFAGQPLVVAGRYLHPGAGKVVVRGKLAGRDVALEAKVDFSEGGSTAISSVWARGRIAELMRGQIRGERPEVTREITDLALAHRLLTPYTAFVAVDTTRVTSGGKAEVVPVPVYVPQGVNAAGTTPSSYSGYGDGTTGEVIVVREKAPMIDYSSTKQGVTLEQDYMQNVPGSGVGGGHSYSDTYDSVPGVATPPRAPTKPNLAAYRAALGRHVAEMRTCSAAKLELQVTIDLAGRITITVTPDDPAVAACLTRVAAGWSFAAPVEAMVVPFTLPAGKP